MSVIEVPILVKFLLLIKSHRRPFFSCGVFLVGDNTFPYLSIIDNVRFLWDYYGWLIVANGSLTFLFSNVLFAPKKCGYVSV